jgi:hypothetical protein
VNDRAATAVGTQVVIDVLANDTDVIARDPAAHTIRNPHTNVHGIIRPWSRSAGQRSPNAEVSRPTADRVWSRSGDRQGSFRYATPGFHRRNVFSYVVQDTGSLISSAATVTVTV